MTPSGAFLWQETNRYLLKHPIGESFLLAPCFFAGYGAAYLFHRNLNGYSAALKYTASIAALFYTVIVLLILWHVLQRNFRQKTILLTLVAILFGINLFHYATYDSLFSHAFSFFLLSLFLFFTERVYRQGRMMDFLILGRFISRRRPAVFSRHVFGFLGNCE